MKNDNKDTTKALLEQLLSELHKEEAKGFKETGDSYLQAQDGQFLGKIVSNKYDSNSILNKYGTYGSNIVILAFSINTLSMVVPMETIV